MLQPHRFHPSILRECDIRGVVGETLSAADAAAAGSALVKLARRIRACAQPYIAVARDSRLSSPELEAQVIAGIEAQGGRVLCLGCGPAPLLYFATHSLPIDAAIIVTASHNPKSHNGFKMLVGTEMVHGALLKQLAALAESGGGESGGMASGGMQPEGLRTFIDLAPAYIDRLAASLAGTDTSHLSIGWDAGNGAAGNILRQLTQRLPGCHVLINADPDGNFPAHHPDPAEPANLRQLQHLVISQELDLGIAFDGDGDRIGAVDAQGRIVCGDQLLAILSRDVLAAQPGATVIADVKSSQTLFDEIARLGGRPLMWKTGHSFIKTKMMETGAKLAGEMSGHIFFADEYFGYDDALYAAIRLLRTIGGSRLSLAQLRDGLAPVAHTPELRIPCSDTGKFAVVRRVIDTLQREGADIDLTDGVRVRRGDGWWLLRASNTQAALVVRAEAPSAAQLSLLLAELRTYLADEAIPLDAAAA
ncbi:MAG TPA: phosphomannomutase/phosphoglucomutase [Terriglobia bacterium]|nr:phosphomannomutase/phosphoglucomutase [Terriglobia bacterium]